MAQNLDLSLDEIKAARPTRVKSSGRETKKFEGDCAKCGKKGHKARDCRSGGKGNGKGKGGRENSNGRKQRRSEPYVPSSEGIDDEVWVRGEANDFPQQVFFDGECNNCGEFGHRAKDCTTNGRSNTFEGKCNNCGKWGHRAKDCTQNDGRMSTFNGECNNCGEWGHRANECNQTDDGPRRGGGKGTRRGKGKRGDGGGGGRDKQSSVSQADLDAEMDSYFNRSKDSAAAVSEGKQTKKGRGHKEPPTSAPDLDAELDSYFNKQSAE